MEGLGKCFVLLLLTSVVTDAHCAQVSDEGIDGDKGLSPMEGRSVSLRNTLTDKKAPKHQPKKEQSGAPKKKKQKPNHKGKKQPSDKPHNKKPSKGKKRSKDKPPSKGKTWSKGRKPTGKKPKGKPGKKTPSSKKPSNKKQSNKKPSKKKPSKKKPSNKKPSKNPSKKKPSSKKPGSKKPSKKKPSSKKPGSKKPSKKKPKSKKKNKAGKKKNKKGGKKKNKKEGKKKNKKAGKKKNKKAGKKKNKKKNKKPGKKKNKKPGKKEDRCGSREGQQCCTDDICFNDLECNTDTQLCELPSNTSLPSPPEACGFQGEPCCEYSEDDTLLLCDGRLVCNLDTSICEPDTTPPEPPFICGSDGLPCCSGVFEAGYCDISLVCNPVTSTCEPDTTPPEPPPLCGFDGLPCCSGVFEADYCVISLVCNPVTITCEPDTTPPEPPSLCGFDGLPCCSDVLESDYCDISLVCNPDTSTCEFDTRPPEPPSSCGSDGQPCCSIFELEYCDVSLVCNPDTSTCELDTRPPEPPAPPLEPLTDGETYQLPACSLEAGLKKFTRLPGPSQRPLDRILNRHVSLQLPPGLKPRTSLRQRPDSPAALGAVLDNLPDVIPIDIYFHVVDTPGTGTLGGPVARSIVQDTVDAINDWLKPGSQQQGFQLTLKGVYYWEHPLADFAWSLPTIEDYSTWQDAPAVGNTTQQDLRAKCLQEWRQHIRARSLAGSSVPAASATQVLFAYVVNMQYTSASGAAYMPSSDTVGWDLDGIYLDPGCLAGYDVSTRSNLFCVAPGGQVTAHEVGHWLGLAHPFDDDADRSTGTRNCLQDANFADQRLDGERCCALNDLVDDTPPVRRTKGLACSLTIQPGRCECSCSQLPAVGSCRGTVAPFGKPDLLNNMMDYFVTSFVCRDGKELGTGAFTPGQFVRMREQFAFWRAA